MKILYLTPTLPYPVDTGGKIIEVSILKSLLELEAEITLFALVEKEKDKIYKKELFKMGIKNIITTYNPVIKESNKLKLILYLFKSLFTIKPYYLFKYYDENLKRKIEKHLLNNNFDIIWVSFTTMSQYLPKRFKGVKVFLGHDVDSLLYKHIFQKSHFSHLRLLGLLEWIKFSIYEKTMYKNFDLIFSVSNKDKKSLKKITGRKDIKVLTPIIDIKFNKPKPKNNSSLVFVGNLIWYPNRDGINWFIHKIFPSIRKIIPAAKLWVIGKYSKGFKLPKSEGVEFLGPIKKLNDYMNKAQVFVVPIIYGTGVRMKILQAMSWGLPVVTTSEGASGLNVKNRQELLIAKNEKEFAKKTILLLEKRELREKLIKNAIKFLKRNYSKEKLVKTLKEALFI